MHKINNEYRNLVHQFFSDIQDRLLNYSQYDSNIVKLILEYICYKREKSNKRIMICNQIKIWTIAKYENLIYFQKMVRNLGRHRQFRYYPQYNIKINEFYHKKKIISYLFYKNNKIVEIDDDNIMFSKVKHIKQQIPFFYNDKKKIKNFIMYYNKPFIVYQKKWSQFICQKIECKRTKRWIVRRFKNNKLLCEQGYDSNNEMLYEIKLKNKKTVIEIYTNLFYNGFCITLNHKKKITKIVEF